MSLIDRTWHIKIRWGVLLEPMCWVLDHRRIPVIGMAWADRSFIACRRCGKELR